MPTNIHITADCGSTWNGKTAYGFEMIRICKDLGVDACKFQLFHGEEYTKAGNIELPTDIFTEFYQHGKSLKQDVTASVFDEKLLEFLIKYPVPFVKFGYSVRKTLQPNMWSILRLGKKVHMSTSYMEAKQMPSDPGLKKFYVYHGKDGAEYPSEPIIGFNGFFPEVFQGYSDHSIDHENALRAKDAGCTLFECHMTLPYSDIKVPDRWFAKEPKRLEQYVRELKG